MFDMSENLLTLIQIALVVIGVLGLYFSFIGYNITVQARDVEREAMIIGNFLLSSSCLTYSDTKSLFDETKLDNMKADSSCLQQQHLFGVVIVNLDGSSKNWPIEITPIVTGKTADFIVAVRMNSGETRIATMVVKI